ncbi:hypothetical protein HID58_045486 [Brassica napus]|uniref:non-specific serine/threonine protein kinase n=1 Tax=Brassica napus TaxID=3708 RepID=A0ABQ8ATV5_BRANA|nr:hypothetical protein HID58_045486 [Brassica napus]
MRPFVQDRKRTEVDGARNLDLGIKRQRKKRPLVLNEIDAKTPIISTICSPNLELTRRKMGTSLNDTLCHKYSGLELWEIIAIVLSAIFIIVLAISLYLTFRRKTSKPSSNQTPISHQTPPNVSEEIKEIRVDEVSSSNGYPSISEKFSHKEPEKWTLLVAADSENGGNSSRPSSFNHHSEKKDGSSEDIQTFMVMVDMELFTVVALGQADKDFRVEVEAIGHVRHKNLVRLLVYCMEGTERMLVYEYVGNGNLEQWLRGDNQNHEYLTWEARLKILIGTAKALAYLHEAIEPKVVHRDIKSSNILIDDKFNSKIYDFGLATLLGGDKSFITTRVMGTFGYVAPEYANYGVVLLEAITGTFGGMAEDDVIDPNLNAKPSTSVLKRTLLTALRCVDPLYEKRPRMSQVARMLESEEYPIPKEDRRRRRSENRTERDSDPPRNSIDTDKTQG